MFDDSTEIEFSESQVRVVLVVLSLEPVERSSVRVTCWYRENKSYRKNYSDIQRIKMYKMCTYRVIIHSGRFNDTLQK